MSTAKQKAKKTTLNSNESDEDSEHELFYYANDRIRLMKEVLKLIKPRKIKAIAPDFMKNLDIDETNSILLEELLGISNKRLNHILNGDNIDTVSTSSDSDAEQEKPVDVISLDDISDSDDEFGLAGVNNSHEEDVKTKKTEIHNKKYNEIKVEKGEHSKKKGIHSKDKPPNKSENDKLMNVLEILELQARARAIRSQLALENINKNTVNIGKTEMIEDDDDTAVIVSSPKNEEIVITSSESEDENGKKSINKVPGTGAYNLANNEDSNTSVIKENHATSKTVDDNICECNNDKQSEESTSKDVTKEVIQDDSLIIMKNSDSNISLDNISSEEKNPTSYKSDSDNDIINLDSDDIEIK